MDTFLCGVLTISLLASYSCRADVRMNLKLNTEKTNISFSFSTRYNAPTDETTISPSTNNAGNPVRYVTMVHGDLKIKFSYREKPYPSFLDPDITVLSVVDLPDQNSMPDIGNGHLATVVHSDTIYMNGLYNGANVTSHRARLQATSSINITNFSFPVKHRKYSLDVGRGMYFEEYSSDDVKVELKMYAHQKLNRLMVTEISVVNGGGQTVYLNLSQNTGPRSDDLDVNTTTRTDLNFIRFDAGRTKEPEYEADGTSPIVQVSTLVPDSISVGTGESTRHLFLTSADLFPEVAMDSFETGVNYFFNGTLESSHVDEWEGLWRKGRIDMEGSKTINRINYAALYYLMIQIPNQGIYEKYYGISPGGLAHGALNRDYQGHMFWDQETWMFPPILFLHSDKGKEIVQSRRIMYVAARNYAKMRGYKGAMFPWESAHSGLNVCPCKECEDYEIHVTGDIALAYQQYLMMTRDKQFLENGAGADVITDIANFWMSRTTYNPTEDQYEIHDVMPPDEYHYPVNNSVYTNSIAKISLLLPKYALSLLNQTANPEYERMANKMYIPFNESGKWHPEYDGYTEDIIVKQADVVLLGYPLMSEFSDEVRRNDLEVYEKVTPGGPAMTWGMFAVGWLELNDTEKAMTLFQKQFENVVPPFNIWSEVTEGRGARNFLTGIGGYLQSLMFGYGGFRVFEDRLQFNPIIPPETLTFNLTGIDYLGGSFDFKFTDNQMFINQTSRAIDEMKIVIESTKQAQTLDIGVEIVYPRMKASLMLV